MPLSLEDLCRLIVWWHMKWLHILRGREFLAASKINMSKAYDKVSWAFLKWLLDRMRSSPLVCRHCIIQRVTTVSYSILINGESSDWIKTKCGLRQGESPLLTCLCLWWKCSLEWFYKRKKILQSKGSLLPGGWGLFLISFLLTTPSFSSKPPPPLVKQLGGWSIGLETTRGKSSTSRNQS